VEAAAGLGSISFRSGNYALAIDSYREAIVRKEQLSEDVPESWREHLIQSLFYDNRYQ